MTLYHGGPPRLKEILPPDLTGVLSTRNVDFPDEAMRAEAERVTRTDRVYLTSDPDEASIFAAFNPSGERGWVYEVEPVGTAEPDPDYTGPATVVHASRARVKRVAFRDVRLTSAGISRRAAAATQRRAAA